MAGASVADIVVAGGDESHVEDGTALCLSGGGYRAMLFHVGVLRRLNELGLLAQLDRVSSVSGGSITAGQLAVAWPSLAFDGSGVAAGFEDLVVTPLRRVASTTIDRSAVLSGLLTPRTTIGNRVADDYRRLLFDDRTLQDLPSDENGPRFVINATNLQSGALWRFSRPYMADYRVGMVRNPTLSLAQAVAASSAFPPVLSPVVLDIDASTYTAESRSWELHREPFTTHPILSDGGVYDNLGVETAWKRYRTILVSDGGGTFKSTPRIPRTWGRHTLRVLKTIDGQVRALRRHQVVGAYKEGSRTGAFIGIATPVDEYPATGTIAVTPARTAALAGERTRLKAMSDDTRSALINWGYAACDASIRSYLLPHADPPASLPYPGVPLGNQP